MLGELLERDKPECSAKPEGKAGPSRFPASSCSPHLPIRTCSPRSTPMACAWTSIASSQARRPLPDCPQRELREADPIRRHHGSGYGGLSLAGQLREALAQPVGCSKDAEAADLRREFLIYADLYGAGMWASPAGLQFAYYGMTRSTTCSLTAPGTARSQGMDRPAHRRGIRPRQGVLREVERRRAEYLGRHAEGLGRCGARAGPEGLRSQ